MGVIRGSSYYTVVDGRSWTQAESQAVALGGNLAAINNWSENIFISNSFKDENKAYYGGDADKDIYLIGLTKESGSWRTHPNIWIATQIQLKLVKSAIRALSQKQTLLHPIVK